MVRVVMLSPPGAGKGTHGRWLTQQTGAAHISSGDLLRAEVARGSGLGRQVAAYTERGDLVPDDLIFSILIPAVVAATRDTGGYVLDGFPRTMPQALRAARFGTELYLTADAVVFLTASEQELVTRLLDRAHRDGRVYDTLGVIRHRLAIFTRETAPLVDYYRGPGILVELSTDRPEEDVRADLRDWLEARGLMPPVAGDQPERACGLIAGKLCRRAEAVATTAAASIGTTPHTVMPTRAPNWLVSTPMSGPPIGVPPMNASMYSPITRPRSRGSTASWTDAFAMDWNARLARPMPPSRMRNTARSGATAADIWRRPNAAAESTSRRGLGWAAAPANSAPVADPMARAMLNRP